MKADRAENETARDEPAAAVAAPADPVSAEPEPPRSEQKVLVDPAGVPLRKSQPVDRQEEPVDAEPRPARRRWVWVAIVVAIAVVLFLLFRGGSNSSAKQAVAASKARATGPVPVIGVPARTADFPVYLTGLGNVTALNTVTVRTRVDGQLVRVTFQEGQLVRAGDLLAEVDPRPFQVQLTQAEGQMAKDQAALKNARLDLQRYQVLAQEDSIPRQQLDTQAAIVAQFEAAVQTDKGALDSAKLNLTYSRITAPLSGRIGLRLVDAGNMVHANDTNGLAVITQLQPVSILFTIPEDSLPRVLEKARRGRNLKAEAFDRDLKNRLATGELLTVDNQIDQSTGTVRLKAVFPNQDNQLFPNQFVNVRLLLETLRGVVIVPTAALQRSPQSTYVYLVKPDQTTTMRPVEVQLTDGDRTIVARGLSAGDVVVIDGVDKLQEGSKVAVRQPDQKKPPASNPPRPAGGEAKGEGRI